MQAAPRFPLIAIALALHQAALAKPSDSPLVAFQSAAAMKLIQVGQVASDGLMVAVAGTPAFRPSFFVIAATSLKSGSKVLFHSDAKLTIGAKYEPHAIKATISSRSNATVTMWTGKPPRTLFLADDKLDPKAWTYDTSTASVRLRLLKGRSEIQIRFDDVQSLRPVDVQIPIMLCNDAWKPLREVAALHGQCAKERVHATGTWEGTGGIYRVRAHSKSKQTPTAKLSVASKSAVSASRQSVELSAAQELTLDKGAGLSLEGKTRGTAPPVTQIHLQLVTPIADAQRVPKDQLDPTKGILIEGEAFTSEGGGAIKKSTEHGKTSGGACIWHWSEPGHWIAWQFDVPHAGSYLLTVMAATSEDVAVRSLKLDGQPLPGAGLVAFTTTGGWGRKTPDEWQPFRPIDAKGAPVSLALTKGHHEVRFENVQGHHMNLDYILLTPRD